MGSSEPLAKAVYRTPFQSPGSERSANSHAMPYTSAGWARLKPNRWSYCGRLPRGLCNSRFPRNRMAQSEPDRGPRWRPESSPWKLPPYCGPPPPAPRCSSSRNRQRQCHLPWVKRRNLESHSCPPLFQQYGYPAPNCRPDHWSPPQDCSGPNLGSHLPPWPWNRSKLPTYCGPPLTRLHYFALPKQTHCSRLHSEKTRHWRHHSCPPLPMHCSIPVRNRKLPMWMKPRWDCFEPNRELPQPLEPKIGKMPRSTIHSRPPAHWHFARRPQPHCSPRRTMAPRHWPNHSPLIWRKQNSLPKPSLRLVPLNWQSARSGKNCRTSMRLAPSIAMSPRPWTAHSPPAHWHFERPSPSPAHSRQTD